MYWSFSLQQWVKFLKIWLNHQVPSCHPLTYWLLGETNGNQSQPTMDLKCSEVFPLKQWLKQLKIWLNHQIPDYHSLTYWWLGASIGNQGQPIMFWSFPIPTMSKIPSTTTKTSNFLVWLVAIINNSRILPYQRSDMAANALCHLCKNLKFSTISEFTNIWFSLPPCTLHISHLLPCTVAARELTCVRTVPSNF